MYVTSIKDICESTKSLSSTVLLNELHYDYGREEQRLSSVNVIWTDSLQITWIPIL
jgi:hypothetical protein